MRHRAVNRDGFVTVTLVDVHIHSNFRKRTKKCCASLPIKTWDALPEDVIISQISCSAPFIRLLAEPSRRALQYMYTTANIPDQQPGMIVI